MEPLENPHWQAVPEGVRALLADLGRLPVMRSFYLAGGTAVVLRLGHRISRDLDLFSETNTLDRPHREEIVAALQATGRNIVIQRSAFTTLTVLADGHHLGFFSYAYELVGDMSELAGVRVASLADVALMKIDALSGRGARRDFIDLYVIAQQIPLETLMELGQHKYPRYRDFRLNALAAITQFETAEEDADPILLQPIEWNEVKQFFIAQARRLGSHWFGAPL